MRVLSVWGRDEINLNTSPGVCLHAGIMGESLYICYLHPVHSVFWINRTYYT